METVDTFGFLLGSWTLTRSIEDHRSREDGLFHGSATLLEAPSGERLDRRARYDEAGELRFGTRVGPASRRLELASLDGATVMVYFADGRPFADLDLRSGSWHGIHLCGSDRYEITTVIRSPGEMHEHWRVRGPAKDYSAVTTYMRCD